MFSCFSTVNDVGALVIVVRIDSEMTSGYRSRWNRSAYGWEAMRNMVWTHRGQLVAAFGYELYAILDWALRSELPVTDLEERWKRLLQGLAGVAPANKKIICEALLGPCFERSQDVSKFWSTVRWASA